MKKKLLCLGLLLMMVFALAACGADYVPPNFGEKGYAEFLYRGLDIGTDDAPKEAFIDSVQALKKFRNAAKFEEGVFWESDYTGSRETVYTQFTEKLDSYSSAYFKKNILIAILHTASSGSFSYTVKSVEAQEGTLNVTLQEWRPEVGTCDIKLWCILIECPKGNYSDLNVTMEIGGQFTNLIVG